MPQQKQPWLKWYPNDWRGDLSLAACSLAARGLWMELLCIMADAEPRGSLVKDGRKLTEKRVAAIARCSEREVKKHLAELEEEGVFSRDEDGTIFSRRMRRDGERNDRDHDNGLLGGHPQLRRGTVPKEQRVRRFRKSDSPEKARRIFEKSGGKCHWCSTPLGDGNWHADHVIAVCDGGGNEEENLVASCPYCNGERAMVREPTLTSTLTDVMVGKGSEGVSDHKAQSPESRIQNPEQGITSTTRLESDPVRQTERVVSPKRSRIAYSADFEEFWRGYPTSPNMSKVDTFKVWKITPAEEREAATRSLPNYCEWLRNRPDHPVIHAERYLKKRRAEGMLEATPEQLAAPPDTRRRGNEPRENPHFAAIRRNLQEAENESDRQGGALDSPPADPDARGVLVRVGEAGRGNSAGREREVFHLPGCEPV